jgi:hypothetical protein
MDMSGIPFGTTDWSTIAPTEHPGDHGKAIWRTREFGGIRVRMVEYTPGYVANHWCEKGHILLCLEGELRTELKDGRAIRWPMAPRPIARPRRSGRSFSSSISRRGVIP